MFGLSDTHCPDEFRKFTLGSICRASAWKNFLLNSIRKACNIALYAHAHCQMESCATMTFPQTVSPSPSSFVSYSSHAIGIGLACCKTLSPCKKFSICILYIYIPKPFNHTHTHTQMQSTITIYLSGDWWASEGYQASSKIRWILWRRPYCFFCQPYCRYVLPVHIVLWNSWTHTQVNPIWPSPQNSQDCT